MTNKHYTPSLRTAYASFNEDADGRTPPALTPAAIYVLLPKPMMIHFREELFKPLRQNVPLSVPQGEASHPPKSFASVLQPSLYV